MGNLKDIDKALDDKIAIEVAKMLATSHEYKTPNVDGALAIVKNYKWEKSTEKISNLEGINKPVNKEKVFNIAEGIKKNKGSVNPFIVVNKLNGIYPQTLGKKILLDGHHRKEACELLGIKEVPVYKGIFTGGAQIPKEELREKTAAEKDIYYHASPVQDIKKFKHSEDKSGNNKGKVIFASTEPSFTVAFGTRWNDGIARMHIETKNGKAPSEDNYIKTVLKYTDDVNVEAPCSMYKLKGAFEPLRCPGDLEVITTKDVEVISEEKFKNFKDMAKFYNLDLRRVSKEHILQGLKGHKFSNFEKKAEEDRVIAQRGAGLAGVIGGGSLIKKQLDRGNLTGREAMWHNTANENVSSILEKGLDSKKALDPNNLTSALGTINPEEMADKVYLGRKKAVADRIGASYENMKNPKYFMDLNDQMELLRESKKNRTSLKASVPSWKLKEVVNPELLGATNAKDYISNFREAVKDKYVIGGIDDNALRRNFKTLSRNNSAVFEGSIGPEVFKSSKKYQKLNRPEVLDYIRSNPKRFTKGVGLSALGLAGLAGGAALINNSTDRSPRKELVEKISAVVYGVEPQSRIRQLDSKVNYEKKRRKTARKINSRQNITENTTSNMAINSIDTNGAQEIKSSMNQTGNYTNQKTNYSQGVGNIAEGAAKILKTK